MDSKVKEQILAVRDSGLTNMFDTRTEAHCPRMNFLELLIFLGKQGQIHQLYPHG